MKAVIGGSYRKHWQEIQKTGEILAEMGIEVLAPKKDVGPIDDTVEFIKLTGEEEKSPKELESAFLEKMEQSDIFVVCNPNGYIGISTAFELGYAF